MRYRGTLPRAARAVLLAAVLPVALVTGCGGGVQRTAPGSVQSTTSTGPDGVSFSVKARNVDLELTGATARLDSSGTARLELTVLNRGPVTEHLALVSVPDGGQGTLHDGAPVGLLTTAGIRLDAGSSTTFGAPADAGDPSIVLPPVKGLKVGGTEPVMLMFGIAGLVRLDVPVRAA